MWVGLVGGGFSGFSWGLGSFWWFWNYFVCFGSFAGFNGGLGGYLDGFSFHFFLNQEVRLALVSSPKSNTDT